VTRMFFSFKFSNTLKNNFWLSEKHNLCKFTIIYYNKSAHSRKKIKDNNKIIFEVLMPDLTIWLHTYLRNKIKQCAFINSNHLHNILSVNIVYCSSSIFILTSIIKMLTFESLLLKHYNMAQKKVVLIYLDPTNLDTFWCTWWAWNCQIIFRFASIHGRACFILSYERGYET
jgi:hypothetical protein